MGVVRRLVKAGAVLNTSTDDDGWYVWDPVHIAEPVARMLFIAKYYGQHGVIGDSLTDAGAV